LSQKKWGKVCGLNEDKRKAEEREGKKKSHSRGQKHRKSIGTARGGRKGGRELLPKGGEKEKGRRTSPPSTKKRNVKAQIWE